MRAKQVRKSSYFASVGAYVRKQMLESSYFAGAEAHAAKQMRKSSYFTGACSRVIYNRLVPDMLPLPSKIQALERTS